MELNKKDQRTRAVADLHIHNKTNMVTNNKLNPRGFIIEYLTIILCGNKNNKTYYVNNKSTMCLARNKTLRDNEAYKKQWKKAH